MNTSSASTLPVVVANKHYSGLARILDTFYKNEAIHRASPVYSQMGIGTGLALCQLYLI